MREFAMPKGKPLLEKYFVKKSNSETKCLYVEETMYAQLSNVLIQLILNLLEQKLEKPIPKPVNDFLRKIDDLYLLSIL